MLSIIFIEKAQLLPVIVPVCVFDVVAFFALLFFLFFIFYFFCPRQFVQMVVLGCRQLERSW